MVFIGRMSRLSTREKAIVLYIAVVSCLLAHTIFTSLTDVPVEYTSNDPNSFVRVRGTACASVIG